MGYYQGESVLDCTYCEEDVLNTAKSNIRQFIEVIIGIAIGIGILGLLLSTVIGSLSCLGGCLGCEACLETAACADEIMSDCDIGCSYVDMTQDNIDRADDCVSCDGIDCMGREGCFSCDGVGDCENWSGTMYYNFKVSYNGHEESYSIEQGDYFYGYSSNEYYRFLGLYSKVGRQFVNEHGEIVNPPRQGMTLYPRFEEYNVGETYYFDFNLSEFGMPTQRVGFQVGSSMTGIPAAPEKTGWKFVGWVYSGYGGEERLVINGTESKEFHLSDFGISPSNSGRQYMLTPKYSRIDCRVTFVIYQNGSSYSYAIEASYEDTFQTVCRALALQYGDFQESDWFFGWGMTPDAEPEEKITPNTKVQSAMTVYAIVREAVYVNFHYNTASGMQTIPVKLREGQTEVRFSRLTELAGIADESTYPGYQFMGWFKTEYEVQNEQAVDTIPYVDRNTTRDYYAHYTKAEYDISYNVMNYATGVSNELYLDHYYMESYEQSIRGAEWIEPQPGYEFIGWRMPSGEMIQRLPAYTYGNIELTAAFEPHTYKILMNSSPDSIIPGASDLMPNYAEKGGLAYGENYTLPVPTRAGQVFQGWYLDGDPNKTIIVGPNGQSKSPLTLASLGMETTLNAEASLYNNNENAYVVSMKALWEVQTFTVTFYANGSIWQNQVVTHNTRVDLSKVSDPSKDGYDFMGWVYESGIPFDENQEITSDLRLNAHFEIKKFTVTFMIESSKGGTATEYKVYNVEWGKTLKTAIDKISGNPNDAALHRRLAGWYKDAAYQTQIRDTALVKEHLTVYAKYDYADQFKFNGDADDQYYYQGETVDFPTATEKQGYTFKGWCTDQACLTTPIWKGVKISSSTARNYYAKYEAIKYTITYQTEGGATHRTANYTIEDTTNGNKYALLGVNDAPTKAGYTFSGWREKGNYGLTGQVITSLSGRFGDIVLVAQYTPNEYTVTLKNEGGNVTKTVTFDSAFNFGVPTEKTGYHFIGWSWTNSADDLATDANGKSLAGKNYAYAQNTSIYPVYAVNLYDVEWRNAETNKLYVITKAAHFSRITEGQAASEVGHTFVGWYTDKECRNEYQFNQHVIDGKLTLYAKFTPNDYQVIFIIGSGIEYTVTLQYGASLAEAMDEAMVRINQYAAENYLTFRHWEDKDEKIQYSKENTVPAKNLTLKPKFHYPVVVQYWEGNQLVHTSDRYYYGDKITQYTYSKTGYTFKGWYSEGTLSSNKLVNFPVTVEDVTRAMTYNYYAKWEANTYTINYYMDGTHHSTATFKMNQTEIDGGYVLKTLGTTEKPGYVFEGWYLTSDFKGEKLATLDNSMGVQNEDLYKSGTINLYGKWVKATYTITLLKTDGSVLTTIEVQYGDTVPTLPTLENMSNTSFNGWILQDNSGNKKKVANQRGIWLEGTYNYTENIVLVADWYTE